MLAVATPTGDPQLVESPGIAVVKNNTTATKGLIFSPSGTNTTQSFSYELHTEVYKMGTRNKII